MKKLYVELCLRVDERGISLFNSLSSLSTPFTGAHEDSFWMVKLGEVSGVSGFPDLIEMVLDLVHELSQLLFRTRHLRFYKAK